MADWTNWNGNGMWWWPFGWIFFIFLIMMIMRLVFWRRGWWGRGHWGHPYYYGGPPGHVPAEEILRQRLAKGEIDETEYARLKEALSK
jgi:putative membrane protein